MLLLFLLMPGRSKLLPDWFGFAVGAALIQLIDGCVAQRQPSALVALERPAMLGLATTLFAMKVRVVGFLVGELLYQPTKFAGQQLLTAGIEILGHQRAGVLDRLLGRRPRRTRKTHEPVGDAAGLAVRKRAIPDEVAPDWRPTYVDYLFLAFSTATAFSATDVAPITGRPSY